MERGNGVDVPRRFLQVKVLYSCDGKTNCLTRLQNAVNMRTAFINESTEIGLMELKSCIQAIIQASPELLAKSGQDYTVYAHDYSEHEAPLVGQGMLSSILTNSSSVPTDAAHQSDVMITGRVCNNIVGFMSNGMQETLEVKIKLVALPTRTQSDNMYHSMGNGFPGSFNPHAWNPPQQQWAPSHNLYAASTGAHSRQPSRTGSPTPSVRSTNEALQQVTQDVYSRPTSRASIRSERPTHGQRGSFDAGLSYQQASEEGPARKRAKVTQADWTGKSAFGVHTTADSLRVAASTAASIRGHRPIAARPGGSNLSEPPPRAPTPRPSDRRYSQPRTQAQLGSSLRRGSTMGSDCFSVQADEISNGSFTTSPADMDELGRGEFETTYNSSPPIFPIPDDMTVLSSPELPALSYTDQGPSDSGYMSDWPADVGDIGVFPSVGDEFQWGAPAQRQLAQPQQSEQQQKIPTYDTNRAWVEVEPGPRDKLPTKVVPPRPHYREQRRREAMAQTVASSDVTERACGDSSWAASTPNAMAEHHPGLSTSNLAPPSNENVSRSATLTSQTEIPTLSGANLSAPAHQQERNSIAQGSAGLQPPAANSPLDLPSDGPCQRTRSISRAPPGSSSGARRKHQIQATLKMSLESGKMPPFCGNCGDIQTVTWRKVFTRVLAGEPRKDLVESQDPNENFPIIGFEPIRDETKDQVTNYRIYKKAISPHEQEHQLFEVLQLCNACGLWVAAKGSMRPEHLWEPVDVEDTAVRRRGRGRAGGKRTGGNPQPTSDIADVTNSDLPDYQPQGSAEATTKAPSKRPAKRPRASSVQPQRKAQSRKARTAASSALNRAVQSSPAGRVPGSEASPIEIMSPENTTRLIFPSPRKDGEFKSLDGAPSITPSPAKSQLPQASSVVPAGQEASIAEPDQNNKENCPPAVNEPDEMSYLFDEGLLNVQMTPKTTRDYLDLMKTPSRSPLSSRINGSSGSKSAAVAFFQAVTPTKSAKSPALAMTPYTKAISQLLGQVPAMADSPSRNFDFGSLPVDESGAQFDLGELEFDDLGGLLPTSPPANFFSLYEDPATASSGMFEGLEGMGGSVETSVEGGQAGGEMAGRE